MDVHEETIDDLSGEGVVIIDGKHDEKVSYCLTVSPEPGPVLAEGSISGPQQLIMRVRKANEVKLALEDGPVLSLECDGGEDDTEWVRAVMAPASQFGSNGLTDRAR